MSYPSSNSGENLARDYREKIFYRFSAITVLVLGPFVIYALVQGRWLMGSSGLLIVAALIIDVVYIYRGRKPPVPPVVVFLPMILTVVVSIPERGYAAILWAYPALVMAYIILGRNIANIVSGILLVTVLPTSMQWLGLDITIRLLVTLSLTIVFANIFSSEIVRIQQHLSELATLDPLTGVYNRRYMGQRIDELLELKRQKSAIASMLMIDVDHFKEINDKHGHDAGDMVLQKLVNAIQKPLRNGDDVFRIGGEEFAVLLPGAGLGVAVEKAERIRRGTSSLQVPDVNSVTVSIGVCELARQENGSEWLKRCDEALYRAKNEGRNKVVSRDRES